MIRGLSYQDEQQQKPEEPLDASFATVAGVYDDGLQLIFDGEGDPTNKHYRYNKSITFKTLDRVKVSKVSGTYVVEYAIGKGKISVAPKNVSGKYVTTTENAVYIKWSDPSDTVVEEQTISTWEGTYLVRNDRSFPKNEKDGTLVLNNQTRDAYMRQLAFSHLLM